MTIHLPKDLQSGVEAAVENGRFVSIDDAMAEAARLLLGEIERAAGEKASVLEDKTALGSIGTMRDAADELGEIVVEAYMRRNESWRDSAIE